MTIFDEPPPPDVDYAEQEGPLCICGHYFPEHLSTVWEPSVSGLEWKCSGRVGNETCTCLGFRASRKDRW